MAICGRFSGCIAAVEYLIVAKDATSLNMSNTEVCAYIPTVLARYDNASNPHPALHDNFRFDVFTSWLSATPGSFPEPNIFHRVIYRESNEELLSHARDHLQASYITTFDETSRYQGQSYKLPTYRGRFLQSRSKWRHTVDLTSRARRKPFRPMSPPKEDKQMQILLVSRPAPRNRLFHLDCGIRIIFVGYIASVPSSAGSSIFQLHS
jgi:hypothetical protein